MNKDIHVSFVDKKVEIAFEKLEKGKFQDIELFNLINKSILNLKENPLCGTKIQKKLWPKYYIKNYSITNLYKYDLSKDWRMIYTINSNEVMILNIILEWFSHRDYERRFKY